MNNGNLTPNELNAVLTDLGLPTPPVAPPAPALPIDDPKPSVPIYGVFPETFGAKGDGKTDDTKAILDAISLAKKVKQPLYFTGGKTYVFTPTKDTDITGIPEFIGYAFIDCSKVDQTKVKTIFAVTGTSTVINSSAKLTQGETSFNVGSGKDIKIGSVLYVTSKEANGNPDREYYYKGQRFVVFDYNNSSGVVTVFETIRQTINSANVELSTYVPPFKISSALTFYTAVDNWIYCFKFIKANVDVAGNFYYFANAAIYVQYTLARCTANIYYSYLTEQDDSNRTCYGIVITDLSQVTITDSYIIGGRHAVSGTGNYPVDYQINGGLYANLERVGSVDGHGNAWSIQVNGATIIGGFESCGYKSKVSNCEIYYRGANAVACIHIATTDYSWGIFIFENCNIQSLGTTEYSGIFTDQITTIASISIKNCSIVCRMENSDQGYAFRIKDNVGAVNISGLSIVVDTPDTGMICLFNVYTSNVSITDLIVKGTSFRIYNKLSSGSRLLIRDSQIEASVNTGLWIQDFTKVQIINVRADLNAQTGIYCNNCDFVMVQGCIINDNGNSSFSSSSQYDYLRAGLALNNCDDVMIQSNNFRTLNSSSAGRGQCFAVYMMGSSSSFILQMNNGKGCKGTSTTQNSFKMLGTKLSQLGNISDFPIPDSLNT